MSTVQKPKKLLERMREALQVRHYALSAEKACLQWVRQFILFHNKRHPKDMGEAEMEAFLTH